MLFHYPNREGFQSSYEDMAVRLSRGTVVASKIIHEPDPKGTILSRRIATDVFEERSRRWQAITNYDNPISSK